MLAGVIRESGFKKAEDFYIALGSGKLTAGSIVNKVLQRLKVEEVAEEEAVSRARSRERATRSASETYGINVVGVDDVLVRLAKCCTPVPGDEIVGYISLGKGITIHRGDCPNVRALMRNPERFTPVEWEGGTTQSFRVQIAVDSWDRPRLLEDVARTFAEHGANIVSYGGVVEDQMAKNWYVAEVGDVKALRALLTALRNVDAVFDAYRVTPASVAPSIEGHSFGRAGVPRLGGQVAARPLEDSTRSLERGMRAGALVPWTRDRPRARAPLERVQGEGHAALRRPAGLEDTGRARGGTPEWRAQDSHGSPPVSQPTRQWPETRRRRARATRGLPGAPSTASSATASPCQSTGTACGAPRPVSPASGPSVSAPSSTKKSPAQA